jgi:hypothetical protein
VVIMESLLWGAFAYANGCHFGLRACRWDCECSACPRPASSGPDQCVLPIALDEASRSPLAQLSIPPDSGTAMLRADHVIEAAE